ncbi:hypothetical protein GY12_18995 [Micrococcus luteus]|nr:hypothetical protein GY12_18995 [Micrococcus luteus]
MLSGSGGTVKSARAWTCGVPFLVNSITYAHDFIPQCFEVALMRLMAAVRCVGRGVWLAHGEGQGVRGGVSVLVWMSMRRERMRRAVAFCPSS